MIVLRALTALRNDTNNEASLAAASNSKVAAQATLRNGMDPDEESGFKANWHAKKGGHTREEAGRATKRKPNHAAHQGGGMCSPQVLTADEEADFEARAPGRSETPMRRPGWPGCRLGGTTKKPPMWLPRGRPTTRPTKAVECAAPKCQRRCLVPPWAKIRGKLDRA
jgi:hypothetical protein